VFESAHFQLGNFSFHSKRFLFSQDTTISVRSRGIKLEYTLLNFCRVNISVLFWFSIFYFGLLLFSIYVCSFPVAPCVISENQKHIRKGFPCLCMLFVVHSV
jgi:hypothetical protein